MSKLVWSTKTAIEVKDLNDLPRKILGKRGLTSAEIKKFLSPDYEKDLGDPFDLEGMGKAVDRIEKALKKSEKIVIYGDYDIDGLSASTLLYDALSSMGTTPGLYIPDRFEEGYGLNSSAIKTLKKNGADLVISVDCGVTAHEQAELAKKIGLDLIITDHHEPSGKAPRGALATINPKLQKKSAFTNLAGVGVAFYLVLGLQKKYGLIKKGMEKWLLDMVALGTVCDVVPMTGLNRLLTKYGLIVMTKTNRAGLKALAEVSGAEISSINETDLGFKLGPRLNAAGRLAHAQKALDLLTTNDIETAKTIALDLNRLNSERQAATKQIFEEANEQAKKYKSDPILVLHSPDWSHGVVGIVASKVSEKWHKPVIILQELESGAKGSARSFGSFNIVEAIADSAELLQSYGGHAYAAGLKLDIDRIKELRYRLNQYAISNMDAENNLKVLDIGLTLPGELNSLEMYEAISSLSPFGNDNHRPYCMTVLMIAEIRLVGSEANHLRLILNDDTGGRHTAIGFGMGGKYDFLEVGKTAKFVYTINENIWNNNRNHQIELVDIKPNE